MESNQMQKTDRRLTGDNFITIGTLKFCEDLTEKERRFYVKAYPEISLINIRKVHCTVCKRHIGTAPDQEANVCMHPILRVTFCKDCFDFYTNGEFSKGDDGSELYCRWCGQGGEVFCCSQCPFVFCKECISTNLSKALVKEIRQNENWNCFSCNPKTLWPLRAQHWALVNYLDKLKEEGSILDAGSKAKLMAVDRTTCCTPKVAAKRQSLSKYNLAVLTKAEAAAKKPKLAMNPTSMFEPECTLVVAPQKSQAPQLTMRQSLPQTTVIQTRIGADNPPPLVVRNTSTTIRSGRGPSAASVAAAAAMNAATSTATGTNTPVYHTINGFRIDLNTASKQDTFRLPNGKLIQVKRQNIAPGAVANASAAPRIVQVPTIRLPKSGNVTQSPTILNPRAMHTIPTLPPNIVRTPLNIRPVQMSGIPTTSPLQQFTIQNPIPNQQQQQQQQMPQVRYTTQQFQSIPQSGTLQIVNGTPLPNGVAIRTIPTMTKQTFPNTPLGQARTQLQNQIFNSMDICMHLTGKIHTLTNSNAYKSVKNMSDIKELYIHISYLLTYAIGRFKGLQDKCLSDMREIGFTNEATSLGNGQLAAALDLVLKGKVDDLDFFNLGENTFTRIAEETEKAPPVEEEYITPDIDDSFLVDDRTKIEVEYKPDMDEEDMDDSSNESSSQQGLLVQHKKTRDRLKFPELDRVLIKHIRKNIPIWNTCHKFYTNYPVTNKMWNKITVNFPESYDCRRRWKEIRRCYLKRVDDGTGDGYVYADKLKFLAYRNKFILNPEEFTKSEDEGEKEEPETEPEPKAEEPKQVEKKIVEDVEDQSDVKIIKFVRENVAVWDEDHIDKSSNSFLWTEFDKEFPANFDARKRWKAIRRQVANEKKVLGQVAEPYKYTHMLDFIDWEKLNTSAEAVVDNDDISNESEKFAISLIEAVEKQTVIWNPRHILHRDKGKLNDLWKFVAEDMKEYDFHVDYLKRRWMHIKQNYLRTLRRILADGGDPKDILSKTQFAPSLQFLNSCADLKE